MNVFQLSLIIVSTALGMEMVETNLIRSKLYPVLKKFMEY